MGESWRDEDYGQSDLGGQSYNRDYGRDRARGRQTGYGTFTGSDFGGRDFSSPRYTADRTARRHEQDHTGRGPVGYTRSDERIHEDARDELTDDWGIDASQIKVAVQNGEVTLDGTVPSRDQKRRAEDRVDDLSGVKHVQNNLQVQETNA